MSELSNIEIHATTLGFWRTRRDLRLAVRKTMEPAALIAVDGSASLVAASCVHRGGKLRAGRNGEATCAF